MAHNQDDFTNFSDAQPNGNAGNQALMVRERESRELASYGGLLPTGYGEPESAGINFAQLLHALRRRWLLAIIVGVAVSLPLAAVIWLITPTNYEVVAWLKVGEPVEASITGGRTMRDGGEFEMYRKSQSLQIKGPQVLHAALNKGGIDTLPMIASQKEPIRFLEQEISVSTPMETDVIMIKMRGKDPKQMAQIVNAVKKSYLDNVVDAERNRALAERDLIDRTYREMTEDIKAKRSTVIELARQIGTSDQEQVRVRQQLLMQQSSHALQVLTQARSELSQLDGRVAVLKQRAEKGYTPPEHLIEFSLARDPTIAAAQAELTRYHDALAYQRSISKRGDRDPAVRRLQSQIDTVQTRLDEQRAVLRPQIVQHLMEEIDREGPGDIDQLTARRDLLVKNVEEAEKTYNTLTNEAASIGKQSADLDARNQEIKQLEAIAANLGTQLEALKLGAMKPPRVRSIEDALVPEGANPFFRYFLAGFVGLVGFGAGAAGVVALEYQAKRVSNSAELATGSGLRVLGTLPNLASLSKGSKGNSLQGILSESIDGIRTILLQQSRGSDVRVVMITSAGDREGKTTVACHLAASLARSGRRTLLLDGDLRSPSAHVMFSVAAEPGLAEVLRGELELEAAIQPTQIDGLMFVAGGQCDYHSVAALAKEPWLTVMQKAREQFEFVVIDGAPVLAYADALLLGGQADATVLSVRRDVSQMPRVVQARERLDSVGIRTMGAVLNGVTEANRRRAFGLPSPE